MTESVFKYRSDSFFYQDIQSIRSGISGVIGFKEEILLKGKWKWILCFNYGLWGELPSEFFFPECFLFQQVLVEHLFGHWLRIQNYVSLLKVANKPVVV